MEPKVVLASLDWIRPQDPRTGLGVASIAAAVRAAGVPTEVIGDAVNGPGFSADAYIERVVRALNDAGPAAICGIAAFVWNEPEVQRLIQAVRANTSATIVLGGPQVSYVQRGALESLYPGVDLFVRGHGEHPMVAIANGEFFCQLGVHRAGQADLGTKADQPLDDLPSPHLDGTLPIGPSIRWETQRGCPFTCSFCQHRESGSRLRNTNLSSARVEAEASAFSQPGVHRISVLDPIFHAQPRRAVSLLRHLREIGLRAQLSLQCRFELITPEFLDEAQRLNVLLEFGLQTTDPAEGKVVGRPNRIDKAALVVEQLHQRGIAFEVSLIYGLPLQTVSSFQRSLDWCLNLRVPRVRAWPLMLLRGTPLHAERSKWGLVESEGDRIPIVIQSSTFTAADHAEMARLAASLGDNQLLEAA